MQEGSVTPGPPQTAVGLGRRNPDGPGRLPSDRPEPCGPGGRVAFVVRVRGAPRTLSPAAIRGRPRQRPIWSLQAIPVLAPRALTRRAYTEKDASLRLLQPTYDHVHPARTIRFPGVRALGRAPRGAARPLREAAHRSAFSRWTSGRSSGGASLDGDPPASAIAHDPFPARVRSLDPERSRRRGHHAVLAELRSTAPPRCASRPRRSLPRTELVTWPLTPPVRPAGAATAPR
jgi:hypothetical protein